MSNKFLSFQAYFVLAGIHLFALLAGESFNWLILITKPLLLLLLIAIFYLQSKSSSGNFKKLVLAALFLSWLGDVLLLFQQSDANFFLAGLVSFLAAHIFYILAFRKTTLHHSLTIIKEKPWLILLFVAYGAGFYFLIRNGLGEMKVPVMLYMVVILMMSLVALNRFRRVEYHSFVLVFAGALSFMASDSLLAINKFYVSFPLSGFLIMLTYIIAQYLIVKGTLAQLASERLKA